MTSKYRGKLFREEKKKMEPAVLFAGSIFCKRRERFALGPKGRFHKAERLKEPPPWGETPRTIYTLFNI